MPERPAAVYFAASDPCRGAGHSKTEACPTSAPRQGEFADYRRRNTCASLAHSGPAFSALRVFSSRAVRVTGTRE